MAGLDLVVVDQWKRYRAGGISVALLAAASIFCSVPTFAADPDPLGTPYRRIFVPADRTDVWPTDDQAYVPIDPAQLRDLIHRANTPLDATRVAAPHAADAVYYARYDGNRLIDGQGCIVVSEIPDGWQFLEWPATGITLRDPRWKDRPATPVMLGAWGADGNDIPRTGLQTDRAGTLLFGFQASAATQSEDASQFAIGLPRALRRKLYLDLPEQYAMEMEGGSTELLATAGQSLVEAEEPLIELPPLGVNYRRWRSINGPGNTLQLRIEHPPRSAGVRSDTPVYREQLTYFLQPHGMDLEAVLEFLDGQKLPPEITVELDSPLKLVHADWHGSPLAWQEQPSSTTGSARYRLTLPAGSSDQSPRLRFQAWSNLPRGELRRLPRPSVADLFWSEGTLEIHVAEALQLVDLRTSGLTPSPTASSDEAPWNGRWQFVKHRQEATAQIAVSEAADSVDASIGTSLELSSASTKAVVRMQLRNRGRSLPPSIEAEVLGEWEIDSVESSSATGFTDWYIDQEDGKRVLRILLRETEAATYPGEIVIEAHLKKSLATEVFSLAELVPLDWQVFRPRRHILTITVIEPLDLKLEGDVGRLTFDDLTETDWELLQHSDVAALVLMNDADLNARLRLIPERPGFTSAAETAVHLERNVVRQQSTIRIEAMRYPLNKVRVMMAPAPSADIHWTDPQTGARLPSTRVAAAEAPSNHDVWEVQLARGDANGQALQASWTNELDAELAIPLLALPDAKAQTARVEMGGMSPADFEWTTAGMVQQSVAAEREQDVPSASFRYDPARMSQLPTSSRLVLRPRSAAAPPRRAVIDRVQLASRYLPEQDSLHQAEFSLYVTGPLRCRLPKDARMLNLSWNGQPVRHTLQSGELSLELEPTIPGAAPSVLRIEFALPEVPLGDGARLVAALPDFGLPLPTGDWKLQLPATYQIATAQYLQRIEPEWHERLLAPWSQWFRHRLRSARSSPGAEAAWREWEIGFAGFVPHDVRVVRLSHRCALAYGLGLTAACLTAWQLVRRPALLAVLAAGVAIAALWLPATSSMFATAMWLGMLAGIGWRSLLIAYARRSKAPRESKSTLPFAPASTAVLLLVAMMCVPQRIVAQLPANSAPGRLAAEHRIAQILIPVDDQGVPAGDKHFVPLSFWEELLKRAKNSHGAQAGDYVILQGLYVGELRQRTTGSEAIASLWNLSWELYTRHQNARVLLPLVRDEGAWQPSALVDGIPTPLEWNPDGRGCRVPIRQPGPHRVTVRVEPSIRMDASQASLGVSLPSLLDAQLQLTYPTSLAGLELPGHAIPTTIDPLRSKVVLPLPRSESIELTWEARLSDADNAPAWEVEQFELLTITPDGANLEVRLELQGPGVPPAEVEIAIDSYLQPRTSAELLRDDSSIRDGRRIVSVPVTREAGPEEPPRAAATLQLVLPRRQILGSYRYPETNAVGLTTRAKVAAIALHNQFMQEMVQNPGGDTLAPGQFSESWGESLIEPTIAYRIPGEQANWTFAVYPRAVVTPPDESLLVACGLDRLDVQYQALFAPGGMPVRHQVLHVSPELRVRSVKLGLPTEDETLRTTRPTPDRVVVFFPKPLDDDFRLVLDGETDWHTPDGQAIPAVTAQPGDNVPQRVQIHRRTECIVEISGSSPADSSTDFTVSTPWGAEAFPVKAYFEHPDRIAELRLRIRENQLRAAAKSLTLFDPTVGVTFVSRIRESEGFLDRIDLEVPADWIGPLDVSPVAQVVEQGPAAPGRRRVQLQLASSFDQRTELELRFSGSIAATQDGTWQVPVIRLLSASPNEHWIALNSKPHATDDVWTLEGVTAAESSPAFQQELKQAASQQVFRVQGDREADFVVRYSPTAEQHPFASLSLADARIREDQSGARIVTTQFLLPPLTSSDLEIEWPDGHEPLGVFVENRLLTPNSLAERRWRVPVGPTDLPLVLTAVCRSSSRENQGPLKYERPKIWQRGTEYPFPLTLWSIETLRLLAAMPNSDAAPSGVAEHATLRLTRRIQLVNTTEPKLAELSRRERSAWNRVWSTRLRTEAAALTAAEAQFQNAADPTIVDADDLQTREQLVSQVTQLLARLAEPDQPLLDAEGDLAEVPPRAVQGDAANRNPLPPQLFATFGAQPQLELRVAPHVTNRAFPRVVGAVVIVALLGAILRWAPNLDFAQAIARHPRWLVAGLGALWWATLTPSAIGAALLLAALLSWAAERFFPRIGFPPVS